MRVFFSEFAHDYSTYAFGYQAHAELEPGENAATAYEHGFLPRSNEPSVHNRFYMARSVRVPTERFAPSSENRRVLKKFDGLFTTTLLSREELVASEEFRSLFLSYFAGKHGEQVMSKERLEGILSTVLPLRGVRYANETGTIGYALEAAGDGYLHYWYPVYQLSHANTCLGMWMMIDAIRRAKDEGRAHAYLGTAYGEKGRYKINFEPLQYWNGEAWVEDSSALKALVKKDAGLVFKREA